MSNCKGYADKAGICTNEMIDHVRSPYCKNCAGKSFENQIARIFEIQGYKVIENISCSGTQNDILAQINIGIINIKVLIECKFKFNENDKVNGEEVRKFYGTREILDKKGEFGRIDKAYIVTNALFAPQAYETASPLDIQLLTEQELLKNLMDLTPYLKATIKSYEKSHIFNHYIDLVTIDGDLLEDEVDTFLKSEDPALVILGDYGTGKTSFVANLSYRLASNFLKGKDVPMPIVIQLRDYEKAVSLEDLITSFLVNKWKIPNGNFETFLEVLQLGYIVLIFDGFDEIARRVDYNTKYKVFSEISKFADYHSKIIVTCRKNFFNHREEFEKIFKSDFLHFEPNLTNIEFEELEIGALSEDQIYEYIYSYEEQLREKGLEVQTFMNLMNSIHDLSDLAKRPVLLNVILETIPKIVLEKGMKMNAALLYEKYTGFWLEREDSKGKTLINSDQKLLFSKQLAWKMFNKNALSISHIEVPREVKQYFNINDVDDIDHFSHDVKSCAFLNNDDKKGFKFIHKSFMEYFTAQHILSEINELKIKDIHFKDKIENILGETIITHEVGFFIKDLISNKKFKKQDTLVKLKNIQLLTVGVTTQKNILSLFAKLHENFIPAFNQFSNLIGIDLSGSRLKDGIIRDINFLGASFHSAEIKNIEFKNCVLTDSIFRNSNLINVKFTQCQIEGSDFSNSHILNGSFYKSNLAYSKFNFTIVEDTNFDLAELTELDHNLETQFIQCNNIENTIGLPYSLHVL